MKTSSTICPLLTGTNNQVSVPGSVFGAILEGRDVDPTYAPDLNVRRLPLSF